MRHGNMRKAKRPHIPAVIRLREFRARRKRNGVLLQIEIPEGLPDALIDAGFLKEWDSENPVEIRKAIERVLTQLIV